MLKLVKNQSDIQYIDSIRELLADDMEAVNTLIHSSLSSDVALINQLSNYIINSGGKRLRPMLVLLALYTPLPCSMMMSWMPPSCDAAT